MNGEMRLELVLNNTPFYSVQSAARGLMARMFGASRPDLPSEAGGVELETLRVGNFEYRMLSAGDWELGRLHDYILEQRQQGWELDTAFGLEEAAGEGGPAALQLWLRRERSSRLRAS